MAGPVHISQWGTYITTPTVDSSSATISVRTSVENHYQITKNMVLRSAVIDGSGKEIAVAETPVTLSPSGKTDIEQTIIVASPELWSIETPSLYTLQSYVLDGTKPIDNFISTFGIRKIEYDTDKGFFLNGQHVKMNGVCLHHDAGCLGAAVPEQAWARRLQLLKDMGCNAIRTSHNPPASEFLIYAIRWDFL
jgi:beta-galactosidase